MKKNNTDTGLELQILRPYEKEVIRVSWFEVKSPTGEFIVSRDHLPLVSTIKERTKLQYERLPDKKLVELDAYGGFLKVQNNIAILLFA